MSISSSNRDPITRHRPSGACTSPEYTKRDELNPRWLPFVDAFRTFWTAPSPGARSLVADLQASIFPSIRLNAGNSIGGAQ